MITAEHTRRFPAAMIPRRHSSSRLSPPSLQTGLAAAHPQHENYIRRLMIPVLLSPNSDLRDRPRDSKLRPITAQSTPRPGLLSSLHIAVGSDTPTIRSRAAVCGLLRCRTYTKLSCDSTSISIYISVPRRPCRRSVSEI
jgi:hypothetical protein